MVDVAVTQKEAPPQARPVPSLRGLGPLLQGAPGAHGAAAHWLLWMSLRSKSHPRPASGRTEPSPIGWRGCHSGDSPAPFPSGARIRFTDGVLLRCCPGAAQSGTALSRPWFPSQSGTAPVPAPSQSGTAPAPRSGPRLFVLQPLGDEVELVAPGLVAIGNADLGHVRLPNVIAIGPVFLVVFTQEPRFLLPEAKTEVPTSEAPLAAPEGSPEPMSGAGAIPRPWAGPPQKDTHLVGQETLQDTPCVGQDTHDVGEDTPHGTGHTVGHQCMGQDTPRGI